MSIDVEKIREIILTSDERKKNAEICYASALLLDALNHAKKHPHLYDDHDRLDMIVLAPADEPETDDHLTDVFLDADGENRGNLFSLKNNIEAVKGLAPVVFDAHKETTTLHTWAIEQGDRYTDPDYEPDDVILVEDDLYEIIEMFNIDA